MIDPAYSGPMDPLRTGLVFAAALTLGLSAGLFFTYSNSVLPGLARAGDRTLVAGMQGINVAILNGLFLLVFLGSFVITAVAVVFHLIDAAPGRWWLLAALVSYALTLGITFRVNVPLNNALDAAGDPDQNPDLAGVRQRFEKPWLAWNHARTVTSVAAFACSLGALLPH
jgi:uncharacterized membrane protein